MELLEHRHKLEVSELEQKLSSAIAAGEAEAKKADELQRTLDSQGALWEKAGDVMLEGADETLNLRREVAELQGKYTASETEFKNYFNAAEAEMSRVKNEVRDQNQQLEAQKVRDPASCCRAGGLREGGRPC